MGGQASKQAGVESTATTAKPEPTKMAETSKSQRSHMQGGMSTTETELLTNSTDLWHPDVVNNEVISRHDRRVYPLARQAPWVFPIPDQGEYYVDLPSTRLYVLFRVTRLDGTNLQRADNVAVCNQM